MGNWAQVSVSTMQQLMDLGRLPPDLGQQMAGGLTRMAMSSEPRLAGELPFEITNASGHGRVALVAEVGWVPRFNSAPLSGNRVWNGGSFYLKNIRLSGGSPYRCPGGKDFRSSVWDETPTPCTSRSSPAARPARSSM